MKIDPKFSRRIALCAVSVAALALMSGGALAANKDLKIGFVGVTSGPAAAWGTFNVAVFGLAIGPHFLGPNDFTRHPLLRSLLDPSQFMV